MIKNLFDQLGFSKNESDVYLCLAELGKSPVTPIAKKLNIPRSTAYSVLESLLTKGIVTIEHTTNSSLYIANPPSSLIRMVEHERTAYEEKFSEQEKAAEKLLEEVKPYFKNENFHIPKLQFFEGKANVEGMLYDFSQEWQSSIAKFDYTWWGYQDHHFVETYRKWFDSYWALMHPEEKVLLLSNKSTTEKKLKGKVSGRQIKTVPKNMEFSSTIWALGDYVVTIMTRQEPHYAFQLKDPVFAANQRTMFKHFWQLI